jgi:hypothetical protein
MTDLDPDPPFARWECDCCDKGIGYTDAPKGVRDWDWCGSSKGDVRVCLDCLQQLEDQAG